MSGINILRCTKLSPLGAFIKNGHRIESFPMRSISLRITPTAVVQSTEMLNESYHLKNKKVGRPVSPHLSIYKFELPALLSVTHRMTGVALTSYATVLGCGAMIVPHDFAYYSSLVEAANFTEPTLFAMKFLLAFPLAFHATNGIRHLVWDAGKCLTMKYVYNTGYASLLVAVGSAVWLSAI